MPRAVSSRRHSRRRKILKSAKGYWGRRSKLFRPAKDAVSKALVYSYRDRKKRKRDFRTLWIARISAACRNKGIRYSEFIYGLNLAKVTMNRKILSNLAIEDPAAFSQIIELSQKAIKNNNTSSHADT